MKYIFPFFALYVCSKPDSSGNVALYTIGNYKLFSSRTLFGWTNIYLKRIPTHYDYTLTESVTTFYQIPRSTRLGVGQAQSYFFTQQGHSCQNMPPYFRNSGGAYAIWSICMFALQLKIHQCILRILFCILY